MQLQTRLSKNSPENQPAGPYNYATTDMAVHDYEKYKHKRVLFERINSFLIIEYVIKVYFFFRKIKILILGNG